MLMCYVVFKHNANDLQKIPNEDICFHKLRKPSFESSSVLLLFIAMTFCHIVILFCFVAVLFGIETMSSITNLIETIGINSIYPRIIGEYCILGQL